MEATLQAKGSDAKARLQLTTTKKGVIWFDQVSLMPTDTYKVCLPSAKFLAVTCHLNNELYVRCQCIFTLRKVCITMTP